MGGADDGRRRRLAVADRLLALADLDPAIRDDATLLDLLAMEVPDVAAARFRPIEVDLAYLSAFVAGRDSFLEIEDGGEEHYERVCAMEDVYLESGAAAARHAVRAT